MFFFFKQKTAYEMRISDWSSDVCSSDLSEAAFSVERSYEVIRRFGITNLAGAPTAYRQMAGAPLQPPSGVRTISSAGELPDPGTAAWLERGFPCRPEEHTSELQSLKRLSYAVISLKKKKQQQQPTSTH